METVYVISPGSPVQAMKAREATPFGWTAPELAIQVIAALGGQIPTKLLRDALAEDLAEEAR